MTNEHLALKAVAEWGKPIAQNDLIALIESKAGVTADEAQGIIEALFYADCLNYDPRFFATVWHLTPSGAARLAELEAAAETA